ncbi:MAG: prefoldin subunit beta [Thermoplasmata archaeon]
MAIPAKLQNEIKQFQKVQQDLAAVAQQRVQMDLKLREITHTLEELRALAEGTPIYRSIGGLLVRATDRAEVERILTEDRETLEIRLKAVERQENGLKERYQSMQREITEAIQAAGLSGGGGSPPPSAPPS